MFPAVGRVFSTGVFIWGSGVNVTERFLMSNTACAQCGTDKSVSFYSPDMDIKPVPFCIMCWWDIVSGGIKEHRVEVTDE